MESELYVVKRNPHGLLRLWSSSRYEGNRRPYFYGLGKRSLFANDPSSVDAYNNGIMKTFPYAFGYAKISPYSYGLGKRTAPSYGLGKRMSYPYGLGT